MSVILTYLGIKLTKLEHLSTSIKRFNLVQLSKTESSPELSILLVSKYFNYNCDKDSQE